MRRLGNRLAIPVLLALIVIGFNWKLLLPGQYTWLEAPDNLNQVLPWLQAQATQWHAGHFPLWDPNSCAGQPLIGQVQPGTLNPLNWILFSMPFKDGFIQVPALHWYWVSIQFLGVLFGYLLCRDLRLSRSASVLSGCAFGLGGFVGAVGWPQLMMSGVLLPLILMFFLRVLRGEKPLANAAASGALLGASFLSGHHNVPTFFTLAMCGLWIYHFVSMGRAGVRKAIPPAAAFFVCFVLIAAAQMLPSYELGQLSLRWSGAYHAMEWNEKVEYSVHDQYSVYPTALLSIVFHGFQQGSAAFIGLVVVTLALLGAAARWHERMVRVLAAVSTGGLLFSLGARSVFHGVLYALVPNLDKARTPSMAEAIFHVGIVALAAYGVDAYRSALAIQSGNRLAIRLLCWLALFIYASLLVLLTVRPEHAEEYKFLAMTALVSLLLAGLLFAWSRAQLSHRAAGVLLVLLLLFELNLVTNYSYQPFETADGLKKRDQDRDIAAFLKSQPSPLRVDVDDREIPYGFGAWFGIPQLNGTQPAALKYYNDAANSTRSRTLLAANYYVGREANQPDRVVLFESQRGLKVFSNPSAMPRVRLVHAAVAVANEEQVAVAIQDANTDLHRTVVLLGEAPTLDNCDGGSVQIEHYRATSVVLRSDSPCRAMVVLADVWFPGWKAYVDGRPARIWKAYNVVRGVVVDAGSHEVRMVYRPASVFIGAALAVLGIMLCIGLRYLHHAESAGPR
jgi:NADH:ubiquinone oxidoreductase subunit 3 (subunit A)